MKLWAGFVAVIALATVTVATMGFFQRRPRAEEAAQRFVTPLGVIPLQDGRRFSPPLQHGYVRTKSSDARYTTEYHVSLSADKTEDFVNAVVERILPARAFAILDWADIGNQPQKGGTERSFLTAFRPTDELVLGLKPYMFRLTNDGFVGFGYAWYLNCRTLS